MKRERIFIVVVAIAVGLGYFLARPSRFACQRVVSAQTFAPDFSLAQLSGQELRLSGYRGKVVLLDFWATWCDPCRDEIPHFVELQNRYGDKGLQIIGVSMDDGPEPVRDFYQHFKMNYPVVMGNAKIGELYGGVLGLPIAFVVAQDGRIFAKHVGATGIPVFEKEILMLLQSQK